MPSVRSLRRGGDARGNVLFVLYIALGAALVAGMWLAHIPQHRL